MVFRGIFRSGALNTAVLGALCALAGADALAQEEEGIVTDRPDFVESSKVVGNRRFQVETSFAYERGDDGVSRERTLSTPTLLRYGVGDAFELRLETDGRIITRDTRLPAGPAATGAGYADTALGVKWHLVDEAGNVPSVAVLLHADLPSGSRGMRGQGVRPSLRLAAEWDLPADLSLGVMPGIGSDRDERGQRYQYGIFGIVLGKSFGERWRGFVEVASPHLARAADGGSVATFDIGAAYLVSGRCQLDTMFSRGLNRNTPDLSWTVGLSFKL
jgi:hypothetical protein